MNNVNKNMVNLKLPKRNSYFTWLVKGVSICIFSAVLTILFITSIYKWLNPPLTWLMVERYFFNEKTKFLPIENTWVKIDSISPTMILAAVAAEDNLFPTHRGFDFESIREAQEQRRQGKRLRGASTISMQVSKNVFLWHGRTWTRKLLEAGFTVLIETLWSKARIMEIYLNVAEFGPAIYGVESSSQAFYGKSSKRLNRYEAAMMATALPSPLLRNLAKPSNYMRHYQQNILRNMKNLGEIDLSKKVQ